MKKLQVLLLFIGILHHVIAQPLPLDPKVRTGKLPNGFTYFIRHNEEPKKRALMYLVNKAGSILEDEDQQGLAHFMEHMSFNGTTHFPKNELVDYLQKSGVRFGADINAYTSFDETVYQLPLPTDKPELLSGGLHIMRDWASEATLDPDEIDKERGVVLEEKRLGKGAGERMRRVSFPVLMNHSQYANRLPIGIDTVLNNFKPETIRRFYKDWYRPDLQAIVIVGDIDIDVIEKNVRSQFADLKNPVHEKLRPHYTIPLTGKNQFISVTDPEMTSTVAEVIIKQPEQFQKTAGDYRAHIIRSLFNEMLNDRYTQLSRQADAPFVEGGASISGFLGGLDNYGVSVSAKPGELEEGFKAAWRETERVRRFGFTAPEFARAKKSYLDVLESQLKEKDKTNSENYVREYQAYFLKGVYSPGIETEYKLTNKDLPSITLQEVNKLVGKYIKNCNRDVLIEAPEKDKAFLPDEKTVNGWMSSVSAEALQPYKDEAITLPLLGEQPEPGKITSEIFNKGLNTTMLTLSNGIRVILKPTSFKNDEILFSGFQSGGTSRYPDPDYQSAANASNIIAGSGVGNYTATQLDHFLAGKQASVSPYINERYQGIDGQAAPKDLETALQLVYGYFTQPRKDTSIFKSIMERSRASLANRSGNPDDVFDDSVSAVLGNYNDRRTGPTLEKLAKVNLDKAYGMYRECFANARGFTFVFTGSFEVAAIRPLLEKYLGGLPQGGANEPAHDLGIHIPAGHIQKEFRKGSEPKATVLLVYSGSFDYTPANKITLDALKEVLEIRMLQRLREDESGVYSPQAFVSTSKYPAPLYGFYVQFGCAPSNVDKLVADVQDEIAKLREIGPLQENIDKWRAEDKVDHETKLQTNDWWLSYLQGQLQNDEDLEQLNSYPITKDKISVESIRAAATTLLGGSNYIKMVLLPETK